MKKGFALLAAVVMLFSLAACGENEKAAINNITVPTTTTESRITSTTSSTTSTQSTESTEQTEPAETTTTKNRKTSTKPTTTTSTKPTTTTTVAPTTTTTVAPTTTTTVAPTTTTTVAPTTTTTQSTQPVHAHAYSPATCTEPAKCSCGATQGSALGHDYKVVACTQPPICKTCGVSGSAALGHTYVAGECINCKDYLSSYCPKLYFTGDMSGMADKKDVRNISFEYRSKQQILTGSAKIKLQGTSSLGYDKKNYTINFYKDANYAEKIGVDVGWGAQNEYCLKANWIDKTHARNIVTAQLAGEVQKKYGLLNVAPNNGAIDGFPIEVYINGTFHGLYTMNIPKDTWMFGMDDSNPNHIVICGENWNAPVLFKDIPIDFNDWAVEVGPETDETLAKIQRLVTFVRDSSDDEFKANFDQYLNLDSTINYYIMANYCWMPDNIGKNMLLATYDGNVWYPSLYDLDTTWGADWTGTNLYDYKNSLISTSGSLLWERLEKLYKNEIAARYFELRTNILNTNYVMEKFINFYNSIPQEVLARETEKWDVAATGTPIPGYSIWQIQEYLNSVIPRLDAKYNEWK